MADKIFFVRTENPKMIEAFTKAQETFKYFWRELSWEYRRIVPALDVACVKVAFTEHVKGSKEPLVEHMWINEINYDGEQITGVLVNDPGQLTNIKKGDTVNIPLNQISDWLFAIQDRAYGGFTVQAIRSDMSAKERAQHDEAWGLDFGDHNNILLVSKQQENPENLTEHPMSRNMKEKLTDFIKQHPAELEATDEAGNTFLHRETIAGNRSSVEALIQAGILINAKNKYGKTALDYAKQLKWEHIIPLLEQ